MHFINSQSSLQTANISNTRKVSFHIHSNIMAVDEQSIVCNRLELSKYGNPLTPLDEFGRYFLKYQFICIISVDMQCHQIVTSAMYQRKTAANLFPHQYRITDVFSKITNHRSNGISILFTYICF